MSATFEDLRILKSAEEIADSVWKIVVQWDEFAKDVVGKQMARSADFGRSKYRRVIWKILILEKNFNFCIIHVEVSSKPNTG